MSVSGERMWVRNHVDEEAGDFIFHHQQHQTQCFVSCFLINIQKLFNGVSRQYNSKPECSYVYKSHSPDESLVVKIRQVEAM